MEINAINVNEALHLGLMYFKNNKTLSVTESRNGPVLKWPTPVTTIYRFPEERVLVNKERDCNPFFHFFEALWMLQGREDVKFLALFLPSIKQFSDDGVKFNGAYGYRMKHWALKDQLEQAIHILKLDRSTRRVVIQLWQVSDLGARTKDAPCNTQLYIWVENNKLNITICNRSNDMLWGAYGANAVHFSMIQEFIACSLGIPMGRMFQFSNNLHVYLEFGPYKKMQKANDVWVDPYAAYRLKSFSMNKGIKEKVEFKNKFKSDLGSLFKWYDGRRIMMANRYCTEFFIDVVTPMANCWTEYRRTNYDEALEWCSLIKASDWKLGCEVYLENRKEARNK